MAKLFPFTLHYRRNYVNGAFRVRSPNQWRAKFLEITAPSRADGFTWYCYDVTLNSTKDGYFTVYDLEHTSRGDVGKEIARFHFDCTEDESAEDIDRKINFLASKIYEERLQAEAELEKCRIADSLYVDFGLRTER